MRQFLLIVAASMVGFLLTALILREDEEPEPVRSGAEPLTPTGSTGTEPGEKEPTPLRGGQRTPVNPSGTTGGDPPAPVAVPSPQLDDSWRDCLGLEDMTLVRECMREWLQETILTPEELANLVCTGSELGARELILVSEAASLWPPAEAAVWMRDLNQRCGDLQEWWSGFLDEQCRDQPLWCRVFADSLIGEDLFAEGAGTTLLALSYRLAADDPRLRLLLEDGARGQWGGDGEQVAYAIGRAWELQADPHERLALLQSVFDSPTFKGRDFEVDALVGWVMHNESVPEEDPGVALAFARELMTDARIGATAAEHMLLLDEWGKLPRRLPSTDREALVLAAEEAVRAAAAASGTEDG